MTTVFSEKAICPICGTEFEYAAMGSTNSFGSSDLDTRPPEMLRGTMCYWLIECPECGYVSNDMEKKAPVDRAFIESEAYKKCEWYSFKSNLSEGFYKHFMLMRKANELHDAVFALLYTIWECDDSEDDNAIVLRHKIVPFIEELQNTEYDENIDAIKMDVLRRGSQFDKLIEEYSNKTFEKDLIDNIRRFQLIKAENKDVGCYTVREAVDYLKDHFTEITWADSEKPNVYFETERMHVRSINETDKENYMALRKDISFPNATGNLIDTILNIEWNYKLHSNDDIYLAAFLKEDNTFLAAGAFQDFRSVPIEIGIDVVSDYRDKGVGTELLKGMLCCARTAFPGADYVLRTSKRNRALRSVVALNGGRLTNIDSDPEIVKIMPLIDELESKWLDSIEMKELKQSLTEYVENYKDGICYYRIDPCEQDG